MHKTPFRNFFRPLQGRQLGEDRANLHDNGRAYQEFSANDGSLKIWLPSRLEAIMSELAEFRDLSLPQVIRQALYSYVYGRLELDHMYCRAITLWQRLFDKEPLSHVAEQPRRYRMGSNTTPTLGKNGQNYKLPLPQKLKEDLDDLAGVVKTPLSHLCREILVVTFLGHAFIPDRAALLHNPEGIEEESGISEGILEHAYPVVSAYFSGKLPLFMLL